MSINTIIQGFAQFLAKAPEFTHVEAELQTIGQFNLKPGQLVQAEILANLPNHRTLVRIAGELLKMELPINVQPGETLAMTFVEEEPRLTFAMSLPSKNSMPVNISDTGKLLGALSRNSARQQTGTLPSISSILDGRPDDIPLFSSRLREALVFSGIFYESHIAQWAAGERAVKELLREPQGKLSARAKSVDGSNSRPGITQNEDEFKAGTGDKSLKDGNSADETVGGPSTKITSEILPIVQDQMQALHTGKFFWQGEVWPDQHMEWTVSEREAGTEGDCGKVWETTLCLEMPMLGTVKASLKLGHEGLNIHIVADNNVSASAMKSGSDGLKASMSEAGLSLAGMVIDCEQN